MLEPTDASAHIGLIVRDSGPEPLLIHLAGHHQLRVEDAEGSYGWEELRLPAVRALVVARRILQLAQIAGRSVPYGFRHYSSALTDDGFRPGPFETGLTCATFVIAMMAACELPLFTSDEPASHEEDAIVQEVLATTLMPAAEEERLRMEIGAPRFRPEVVAVACMKIPDIPCRYDDLKEDAERVLGHVRATVA